MNRAEVEDRIIILGLAGSQSYGTALPSSDTEYKGVCIGKREHYLGFKTFEQKDKGWTTEQGNGLFPELDNAPDTCVYELRKFIQLLTNNNPNILELLWLDDDQYLELSLVGEHLRAHRSMFLSKKVKHSFSGYAMSQIKRVENHRKWLLNPPERAPLASDFGLDDNMLPLSKDEVNAFLEFLYLLIRDRIEWMQPAEDLRELLLERIDYKGTLKQHSLPADTLPYVQLLTRSTNDFIHLLHVSQEYRTAMNHWKAYQDWLKGRNPERAALEIKCGYDSKHMSHCLRLLKMGIEILRNQELIVNRKRAGDAAYLKNVRLGEFSYQEIREEADRLFAELDEAYAHTTLPRGVNHDQVNELCMQLVEMKGFGKPKAFLSHNTGLSGEP